MPASPSPKSDLPPWLRRAGGGAGARNGGGARRAAALLPFAVVLFAAGVGVGFIVARRHGPAVAAAPAPVCPPAAPVTACAEPSHATGPHLAVAARKPHHATAKPLVPLPEAKPMDDDQRTQALRTFAEQKAPELRDCLAEPERGPPLKLGAAFEIGANGAVDFVQILGADTSPKDVRHCYSVRLKRWRFPQALLRGEEKLLVNFVL
jgi:hypothetical protein